MSRKQDRRESLHQYSWQHNISKREKYEAQIMRKPVEQVEIPEGFDLPESNQTPLTDQQLVKRKAKPRSKYCRKSGKWHEWEQWEQTKYMVGTRSILSDLWIRHCKHCHKKDTWMPPLKRGSRFLAFEEVLPPGFFEKYEYFACGKCGKRMKRVGPYEYMCPCNPDAHLLHA